MHKENKIFSSTTCVVTFFFSSSNENFMMPCFCFHVAKIVLINNTDLQIETERREWNISENVKINWWDS